MPQVRILSLRPFFFLFLQPFNFLKLNVEETSVSFRVYHGATPKIGELLVLGFSCFQCDRGVGWVALEDGNHETPGSIIRRGLARCFEQIVLGTGSPGRMKVLLGFSRGRMWLSDHFEKGSCRLSEFRSIDLQ